jgi:membrane protease YdiL (CAAX protease family)
VVAAPPTAPAATPTAEALPADPIPSHAIRGRGLRFAGTLLVVLAVLVAANLAHKYGPAVAGPVLGPVVALGLIGFARWRGLSWADLGLARQSWSRGAGYAAALVALVAVAYAAALAVPAGRLAFEDVRYRMAPGPALVTALIVIPLGTVVLEEVGFRGVLLGLVHRHRGARLAAASSSALFGLWHVLPSLQLHRANPAVAAVVGHGGAARVLAVSGAVCFTTLAGLLLCELRRRSGSLLASAGLHWAVNALGVLAGLVLSVLAVH